MIKTKSNSGNTGVDIVISIGIITVLLTVLIALYMNVYVSNTEIERKTQAINYGTQILEKVAEFYYADINNEKFQLVTLENGKNEIVGIEIAKGYNVSVNIVPYSENEQTDVIKNVKVTVTYNVAEREENVTLNYYKTKETLIIPNIPELNDNLIPVRAQNNNGQKTYKITNSIDNQWYNYSKKIWALAITKDKANSSIKEDDLYVWIPRYAYYIDSSNNTNIQFLYADKDKTVDTLGNLQDISNNYIIHNKFTGNNEKGYWVKLSELDNDEVATTLNNSQYGKLIY